MIALTENVDAKAHLKNNSPNPLVAEEFFIEITAAYLPDQRVCVCVTILTAV